MPLLDLVDLLPPELWVEIAFHTVSDDKAFPGSLTSLTSMLLLCRKLEGVLSWKHNKPLYSSIFEHTFDFAAPSRRLSQRWLTPECQLVELKKRSGALKRIRARQFQMDDAEDLWTAYLMILEADGKNEVQLLTHANLGIYLEAVIMKRLQENRWLKDWTVDSLVIWLMWFTANRDSIRRGDSPFRNSCSKVFEMLVAVGYRYPSLYAPDKYFFLPLDDVETPLSQPGSFCPPYSEIVHYGNRLRLSVPVVSSAAILNLTAHAEAFQVEGTFKFPAELPLTRQDAPLGPTLEDYRAFYFDNRIVAPAPNHQSAKLDGDWYRLVSCFDPHLKDNSLRGAVYPLGSLTGSWAGRILNVDYSDYMHMLLGKMPSSLARVAHKPLYWELQEHHCVYPNEPLSLGLDAADEGDNLHAFIPKQALFNHTDDALEVYDPKTGQTARYDTFLPDAAAPYAKAAHEKLQKRWISDASDGEIAEQTLEPASDSAHLSSCTPSTSYNHDDDEYSDTASRFSSGVSDILITGKVGTRHALAWGDYTIHARVRPWDGLVIMYRFPTDPANSALGSWVFKGYIHDRNLVGRWRETSTPKNLIGYEGGFVVAKTDSVHG